MRISLLSAWLFLSCLSLCQAQESSRNVQVVGQLSLEGGLQATVLDQDPNRPLAYTLDTLSVLHVVDLSDPAAPVVSSRVASSGGHDLTTFVAEGRVFVIIAGDRLTVVDVSQASQAVLLSEQLSPEPFSRVFAYKHSTGQGLLFGAGSSQALALDLSALVTGTVSVEASLSTPPHQGTLEGFGDLFAGFYSETQEDRLYLAAAGGYFVYDITNLEQPVLKTSVLSAAVQKGHAIAPTPDGAFALTLASYRTAPLRIFDLAGERVRTAVGAWMEDWQSELEDVRVRWPFAFVAGLESGLYVINIFDPAAPYTDAWFRPDPPSETAPLLRQRQGIVSVNIRNRDGLIVATDHTHGLWLLRLEAFGGWHGQNWGVPNVSEVQDWVNGPY
ncbi:MAG: hypothetical protein OXH03_05790 [Bacteroidetes bacterium]|nr:hypothetical protein [Bacteroidota bacterium]MDE2671578.1 hypothetical protein [Bacteroidota bacterium]